MPQQNPDQISLDHAPSRVRDWLEYTARAIEEARNPSRSWLERLQFLATFSSLLDRFFETLPLGPRRQARSGADFQGSAAGEHRPTDPIDPIARRIHELVAEQYRVLNAEVLPGLAAFGIEWVRMPQLTGDERKHVGRFFFGQVYPVLTPLAIDLAHPFPLVTNKSLNIALQVELAKSGPVHQLDAVVQVPPVLERIVPLPGEGGTHRFVLVEEVIAENLSTLFGGFRVLGHTVFRVTRGNLSPPNEDETSEQRRTSKKTHWQRAGRQAVRLELSARADERFTGPLSEALKINSRGVYHVDGPVDLTGLLALRRWDKSRSTSDQALVTRGATTPTGSP